MGLGIRIFFLEEDGSIRRIPWRWYEEMYTKGRRRFPEYANMVVRIAEVIVELENRKVTRIVRNTFHLMVFDANGGPDQKLQEAVSRLAVEAMPFPWEHSDPNWAQAERTRRAAQRQLSMEYSWSPSADELKEIQALSLGR